MSAPASILEEATAESTGTGEARQEITAVAASAPKAMVTADGREPRCTRPASQRTEVAMNSSASKDDGSSGPTAGSRSSEGRTSSSASTNSSNRRTASSAIAPAAVTTTRATSAYSTASPRRAVAPAQRRAARAPTPHRAGILGDLVAARSGDCVATWLRSVTADAGAG